MCTCSLQQKVQTYAWMCASKCVAAEASSVAAMSCFSKRTRSLIDICIQHCPTAASHQHKAWPSISTYSPSVTQRDWHCKV